MKKSAWEMCREEYLVPEEKESKDEKDYYQLMMVCREASLSQNYF